MTNSPHRYDHLTRTLCKHCDHFVDENDIDAGGQVIQTYPVSVVVKMPDGNTHQQSRYVHLEDGEQDFDHDPEPSDQVMTQAEWRVARPDLFKQHPDGKVGPNSIHHSQRGKYTESDEMRTAKQVERDAIDGARFRALLSCPRIRIVGSAGFKKDNPDTYRHLGLEFWSHYGTNDITVPMARHMLTELADHMIQINSDTAPAAVTVPVPAVLTSDDLDGLHACMEVKNLTDADVRHVLRVARSGVVDNGMPLNDALAELVGKYGLVKTNLLLGHMADIMDHYDAISDSGYVLADAIQDFIDGKATP